MTDWTLSYIAELVVFLGGLISGLTYLSKTLRKWLSKVIDEQNQNMNKRLDEIDSRLNSIDLETTKNYLVQFISEVKRGEIINETERQRFYEQYEHYTIAGGNTYIKAEVESLKKKGMI